MSVPIIYSDCKHINSVFVGLKAFKTINYFFINGNKKQNLILVEVGFLLGFIGGFFGWVHPKNGRFLGMYPGV